MLALTLSSIKNTLLYIDIAKCFLLGASLLLCLFTLYIIRHNKLKTLMVLYSSTIIMSCYIEFNYISITLIDAVKAILFPYVMPLSILFCIIVLFFKCRYAKTWRILGIFLFEFAVILSLILFFVSTFIFSGKKITIEEMTLLFSGTNIYETINYLIYMTNAFYLSILCLIVITVIIIATTKNNKDIKRNIFYNWVMEFSIIVIIIFSSVFYFVCFNEYADKGMLDNIIFDFVYYTKGLNNYKIIQTTSKFNNNIEVNYKKNDEIHIVIIGESHNKNHFSIYGYEKETTPWLHEKIKSEDNFIQFNKAYSNHVVTIFALQYALMSQNQYNTDKHPETNNSPITFGTSIINVFKKAGYKTYWLSNHFFNGFYDNMLSIITSQADDKYWTKFDDRMQKSSSQFDGVLLPLFKEKIQNEKKAIFFIHLYGSHMKYKNRYPENFNKMTNYSNDVMSEYDNSILYFDYVLSEIFDIASKNSFVQTITYFSDHGEDVKNPELRNTYNITKEVVNIPMFIWFSDKYKKENSNIFQTLQRNKDKYFTNDLIYDTLIGVYDIKTLEYNSIYDISSRNYKLDSSMTKHNKISIFDLEKK